MQYAWMCGPIRDNVKDEGQRVSHTSVAFHPRLFHVLLVL